MTYCLTLEELAQLMGKVRASAQARSWRLWASLIAHRRRRDGSIVVLRVHAEVVSGYRYVPTELPKQQPQINLEALLSPPRVKKIRP